MLGVDPHALKAPRGLEQPLVIVIGPGPRNIKQAKDTIEGHQVAILLGLGQGSINIKQDCLWKGIVEEHG